jgi:hypothetical protein
MSGEASGEVWKRSPLSGSQLLVHLAIGDVVNDLHDNQFWMSTDALAKKAKVSRSTVTDTLRILVDLGYLELLESGGATRKPSRYRFLFTSALAGSTSALSDSTRPDIAHKRKELKEIPKGASAFSGLEPDPNCIRCRGDGILRDAGFERPCSCCDERPFVEAEL